MKDLKDYILENNLSDVDTNWSPREGLFTEKNPKKIANYLLKNSKDKGQAMKRLTFYMNRAGDKLTNKTVLNQVKNILSEASNYHSMNDILSESLRLSIDDTPEAAYTETPKDIFELRNIIDRRYNKLGPGTKTNPIDFNDIDVSEITTFFISDATPFRETKFRYIDVSDWNVANCTDFRSLFGYCRQLVSVGDLSNWNMSNAKRINAMFAHCPKLKQVGDLGKWDIHDITWSCAMFSGCEKLEYIGDISNWDLSTADVTFEMFYGCKNLKNVGDISKWKISKNAQRQNMFTDSGITIMPTFV